MVTPLVSIILPSYNRFEGLLCSLESIYNQTFKDFEVLIINDGSADKRYKQFNYQLNTKVIHLKENSVLKKGYFSDSIRNFGIEEAKGKYIAFLDDDDYWFSNKLEKQIEKLETSEVKMVCSEAICNFGLYDSTLTGKLYNQEFVLNEISGIYKRTAMKKVFNKNKIYKFQYPEIWTSKFIRIHNCIITSSVVVEKELLNKIGNFRDLQNKKFCADWDCWLGLLTHTNCHYISEPLLYYNLDAGQNSLLI